MKVYENLNYNINNLINLDYFKIDSYNDYIINYESFLLINPQIDRIYFPIEDILYYKRVESELDHIIYKFNIDIIKSNRQVIICNDECISTIQFIFSTIGKVTMNVFQRSANIYTLENDIRFLRWYLEEKFEKNFKKELNIFVSMPHKYKEKK